MVPRCWEQMRTEDLIWFGACDCQDECQYKAMLVDELMAVLERDGPEVAALVTPMWTRTMLDFKSA